MSDKWDRAWPTLMQWDTARPSVQNGALFTREMIAKAMERYDPAKYGRELQGDFPTPQRPPAPPPDVIRQVLLLESRPGAMYPARPEDYRGLNPGTFLFRGKLYDKGPLDEARRAVASSPMDWFTPQLPESEEWARFPTGTFGRVELRSARIRRQALERAGRILVSWLIASARRART